MSKPLLIGLLIAVLSGIAALVWWQSASYDKREQNLKKQLEEERQLRLRNDPYTPSRSSSENRPRQPGSAAVGFYL